MFGSLHIQGFRCFEDLQLHGLGAVNLVVGRNNVGKTSLLEAIKLRCAGTAAVWELRELLQARQEIERQPSAEGEPSPRWNLSRVFHCEAIGNERNTLPWLAIGPVGAPESTLRLELGLAREIENDTGEISRRVVEEVPGSGDDQDVFQALVVSFGDTHRRLYTPKRILGFRPLARLGKTEAQTGSVNCNYRPARGFTEKETGELWDSVVLTDLELDVLCALRIIEPGIERVSVVVLEDPRQSRVPLARRSGSQEPEALRSLGDGMNRIFEMALGLANSKGGVLLIDEVENGIHYSVQQELWSFIFETAYRLGTQVFATTHSWDCIEAFQKSASAHPAVGTLIRLFRHEGKISAEPFGKRQLEILTKESIEVR
ncbi:MAG: AAA family ATPase [Thermodesulfobacteriota bacterium]